MKIEPKIRIILRLGEFQILFLDRIPDSAAVNIAVAMARHASRNPKASGLVNAVLRNLARSKDHLPPLPDEWAEAMSIRYSHPRWLVEEFLSMLGTEETECLLQCHNLRPPNVAQVNTVYTTENDLQAALAAESVTVEPHPWLPDCITLAGTGDLERLPSWQNGLFYIQDAAAKLAVLAAGILPHMDVLDACAAPGGKSFAAAILMGNKGSVRACDLHTHKIKLIEAGAARLKLTAITAEQQNATLFRPEWENRFDAVLADVPCSGLGVIRKKPDIRYKAPEPLAALPKVQTAIIENVHRYVKPGGVLLYSTCTILRRENEDIIADFLVRHPEFSLEPFTLPGPIGAVPDGQVTLWPHRHGTDGFFIAKLRKAAES